MSNDIKPLGTKPPAMKPLVSPKEFYRCHGSAIGLTSIYEGVKSNRIKHIKIGRKILIPASEVEAWPLREAERVAA